MTSPLLHDPWDPCNLCHYFMQKVHLLLSGLLANRWVQWILYPSPLEEITSQIASTVFSCPQHWSKWNENTVTQVFKQINTDIKKLQKKGAKGFIIKIGDQYQRGFEITIGTNTKWDDPYLCTQQTPCRLCTSSSRQSIDHIPEIPKGYNLIESKRQTPLITHNKITYNVISMPLQEQVVFFQVMQQVALKMDQIKEIYLPQSHVEFHNRAAGWQTQGHTHGHLKYLLKDPTIIRPSKNLWHQKIWPLFKKKPPIILKKAS